MRGITRLSAIMLTICFGLIGTTAAFADTQTKILGDDRGTGFASTCPPGEALNGLSYIDTSMLAGIASYCVPVGPNGAAGKGHRTAVMYGPDSEHPDGGYKFSACPSDMAVKGLEVFFGDNLVVQSIRLSCHVPVGSKIGVIIGKTFVFNADSTTSKSLRCPSGMHATGFIGTYFGGIHSIGLSCHDFSAPAEQDTAGDQTADTGDEDDEDDGNGGPVVVQGDNGPFQFEITIGPNGVTFGQKGKVRVLREASTVYSDKGNTPVDYLEAGDKVQVLACEDRGNGWCQLAGPETRLIWGGDFKK